MDVRFISKKDKGIYAYVEYTDGKKYEVDYTYLKNVASVKKAINVEYERMDCYIVITECDGLYETAICEKTFVAGIRKNWKTIKPAEADSQPAEADEPAEDYYKKYLCIMSEIQNQDNEYFRKYKLFDVSKEVNNDKIKKFTDKYMRGMMAEAYIIEKTGSFYWVLFQKKYKIKSMTKWVKAYKTSTCKAFVDLFNK